MRRTLAVLAAALAFWNADAALSAQTTPLLPPAHMHAIRAEASGERPMVDFANIISQFSGFAPSTGGDRLAEYLAARMRQHDLEQVQIEGFPADGRTYVWAFLTEPAWEGESGTLQMLEPRRESLADFSVHRVVLGRFSRSADVRAELVDVGAGTSEADFQGKNLRGKLVLATGPSGEVHARAVWGHQAAGVIWFRAEDESDRPTLVSNAAIVPWSGPSGERPGFAFSLSHRDGMNLRRMLANGQRVLLQATVKAVTGAGEYKQVSAAIPGSDPSLPEVWIKAHSNHRNTGGGNNLTGVGATIEVARVLRTLTADGTLPRPRRTIRFFWSAEHYGATYQFHRHPDWLQRVLALLNVDMTGFDQRKTNATMWLYRLPHSLPHFVSDVAEEFLRSVGRANTTMLAGRDGGSESDPTYAPSGSRDQMRYGIAEFWGPSDHEDVVEGSLRVPAVLYNDWPDPFIGTQEDDLDKVDATQMRRSVLAVATTAYYLASVDAAGAPALVTVMVSAGMKRLADDMRRASAGVEDAGAEDFFTAYREAVNVLTHAIRRETAALDSVSVLGTALAATHALDRGRQQLAAIHDANRSALEAIARRLASSLELTWRAVERSADEQRIAQLVPSRNLQIRGPVNIFRPEYGRFWLIERSGDPDYLDRLAIARAGRYVWFEAINFVDGERTLLDIRDAVSAEYRPLAASDIEQYFRFLEQVGVVSISAPSREVPEPPPAATADRREP